MTVLTQFQTPAFSIGWKGSFNLAVLLHILLISSALILPNYLGRKVTLPEIYSVDLVNIADFPAQSTPAAPVSAPPRTAPPVKTRKPKAVKAKKTAPIAPVVEAKISAPPVKAVSLKPLKRKLKKKLPPETSANNDRRKREVEQRRRQLLEEARRQKAIADAEAKAAANEALNALKQSLRADAMVASAKTGGSRSRRSGGTSNSLEAQYFSQVFSHLHQYWSLPDIKTWSPDLTAVVVVNIARNGGIVSHSFEKRSGDPVFDRFVSRTMQEANPLPAIPAALKKNQYTIGLRFRPGGIH